MRNLLLLYVSTSALVVCLFDPGLARELDDEELDATTVPPNNTVAENAENKTQADKGLKPIMKKVKTALKEGKADMSKQLQSHMSRKVFERACAASKDVIDEVVLCVTSNRSMLKFIKPSTAGKCYEDSFGMKFDLSDTDKHRDLICGNREKFEQMTACVYRKTAEVLTKEQIDKMTEAFVDVGLCIVNALDGD